MDKLHTGNDYTKIHADWQSGNEYREAMTDMVDAMIAQRVDGSN